MTKVLFKKVPRKMYGTVAMFDYMRENVQASLYITIFCTKVFQTGLPFSCIIHWNILDSTEHQCIPDWFLKKEKYIIILNYH